MARKQNHRSRDKYDKLERMSVEKKGENKIVCTQDFLRQYFVSESVGIQFGLNNKTVKRMNEKEFDEAVNCIMASINYSKSTLKRTASSSLLRNSCKKHTTLDLPFILDNALCLPKGSESNNYDTNLLYSDTLYEDYSLIERNDQRRNEIEEDFSFTLLQSEVNEMRPISSSSTPQILQSDYSLVMHEAQASNGSIFQFSSP
ncbi:hypothetical protein SMKI_08G2000 [Saccharomyces mikatae IFO 1815]|uniref:Uncharacterized protein n=1 Tax=Saccharomyces mikatae IFO 1815 TaxID=226126 RepID=A0AA35J1P3_SACMI|nr:uncharacterized protein SMKI_08G2000 [Saccharomyces mikatae IFO 1815]CAI4039532.1 hypothetical protein SMKI_08G2000 [Saccharomyces mikatae IFO 1815]